MCMSYIRKLESTIMRDQFYIECLTSTCATNMKYIYSLEKKLVNKKKTNNDIINRYKQLNLIAFSGKMTEYTNANGEAKKQFNYPMNWAYTNNWSLFNSRVNGHALRMGTKVSHNEYVILLDIDNKNDTVKRFENNVLKKHGLTYNTLKSPTAITGNNGYHCLFKVDEERYQSIKKQKLGLTINGEHYDIDIKAENGLCYCAPTQYTSVTGNTKTYEWINDSLYNYDISLIPTFLYDIILDNHINKVKTVSTKVINKITVNNEHVAGTPIDIIIENVDIPEDDLELFKMLSFERCDEYQSWVELGILCYCLYDKAGFKIFDMMSKKSSKYDSNDVRYKFTQFLGVPKKYSIGTLHYWAKLDNESMYIEFKNAKLSVEKQLDLIYNCDHHVTHSIDARYLLNLEKKLNDNTTITNCVRDLYNNKDFVSLNIKSPYDTGKTQLIKEIITNYNPKKVLWLSYRLSFTDDILKTFKVFNLQDYRSHKYHSDRLIIQLESLLKIDYYDDDFERIVPEYDLIMIDEIESILSQFSSPHFKRNSIKMTFDYIYEIIQQSIKKGGKIISLDGDMNNRSYDFLKQFGQSINLQNTVNFNKYHLDIIDDEKLYFQSIYKALDSDKKIVVVTMSGKKFGKELYDTLKDKYPNKSIRFYSGESDGEEKKDLRNVDENWLTVDILIYSPTICAGVSFDKVHFDMQFGVICSGSCSSRDYHQMLKRVRKFKENNILIYNLSKLKENTQPDYASMKDMQEDLKNKNDYNIVTRRYIDKDDKRVVVFEPEFGPYETNYCYNKAEEYNNNENNWLSLFLYTAKKKGYTFNVTYTESPEKAEKITQEDPVLNAKDITDEEYEIIKDKKKAQMTTYEENQQYNKHYIKRSLNVDKLDECILKHWNQRTIYKLENYKALIDTNNIHVDADGTQTDREYKTNMIRELIMKLGYKNMFDDKVIDRETMQKSISSLKDKNIFADDKTTHRAFNTSSFKLKKLFNDDDQSLKRQVAYINTALANFSLSLKCNKKSVRVNDKVISKLNYSLVHINGVTEIIAYGINNGDRIHDSHNIFKQPTTYMYKHLIVEKPVITITLPEPIIESVKGLNYGII